MDAARMLTRLTSTRGLDVILHILDVLADTSSVCGAGRTAQMMAPLMMTRLPMT